jgi:hypothetical protein
MIELALRMNGMSASAAALAITLCPSYATRALPPIGAMPNGAA